jgi:hypothetical protein
MSDAEILEILNLHVSNVISAFGIYLSLTFAYLTAIYLIGVKLTKLQVIPLAFLYIIWAAAFAAAGITHLTSQDLLIAQNPDLFSSFMWRLPWTYIGTAISLLGTLICIYFTYDVRRSRDT